MKKMKRFLAVTLSAAMVLSMAPVQQGRAEKKTATNNAPEKLTLSEVTGSMEQLKGEIKNRAQDAVGLKDEDEVTIIVDYEEAPVLERIDAKQYEDYGELEGQNQGEIACVESEVENVTDSITSVVSRKKKMHKPELLYTYSVTFTGCAMRVQYGDIEKIKEIDGVREVYLTQRYEAPNTVEPRETTDMLTSRAMIGADQLQENSDYGYSGEGTVVAVLDTGVAYEHEAFSEKPQEQKWDKEAVSAILNGAEKLQAAEDYSKKTKSGDKELVATGENASASAISSGKDNGNVYKSDKVPFAYDYSNHDTNPTPTNENNHGTHVAGTVAANCDEIKGVAKEAQLVAMKVFRDDGYAYEEELMAALEDCAILSVDSVNMSLGSCCGFTKVPNDRLQAAYSNLGNVGVSLNISAGNSYTSAYHNNYGGYSLAENPDDGIVGTPSTQDAAISVASIENTHLAPSNVITVEGEDYPYIDHGLANELRVKLEKGEYGLVDCKLARTEDVAELDLSGKVAIAQRGEINFTTKVKNVADKGAVALVVYNNTDGTQAMSISEYYVPAVAISKEDGEKIINALNNGEGKVSYDPEKRVGKLSPTANEMSDFSSWGTTPELRFKPEITAPGGNIYSAYYIENGKSVYGMMSGTSMAAPHMAGAAAIMRQYIKSVYGNSLSKYEEAEMINALEMSTAKPVRDKNTKTYYSPRKQGAGLLDLMGAVTTPAYLKVEGCERPEAILSYNNEGEYSYTVRVVNMGKEAIEYYVDTTVLAEDILNKDGNTCVSQTDIDITDAVKVTYRGVGSDGMLYVPVGGTSFTVNLKVNKNADVIKKLEEAYSNGYFVEGFTRLNGEKEIPQLSVPFLGFCGDWAQVPMFDAKMYDVENGIAKASMDKGSSLINIEQEGRETWDYPLGMNYFMGSAFSKKVYGEQYIVLSANSDKGFLSTISATTYMLRGAKKLDYIILNEKGEEVARKSYDNVRKTFYHEPSSAFATAENFYDEAPVFKVKDKKGNILLPNGNYEFKIIGTVGGVEDVDANRQELSYHFTVDSEKPIIDKTKTSYTIGEDGHYYLEIGFSDNHYAAGVMVQAMGTGLAGGEEPFKIGAAAFEMKKDTERHEGHYVVDLGTKEELLAKGRNLDISNVTFEVYDYAMNMAKISLKATNQGNAPEEPKPEEPKPEEPKPEEPKPEEPKPEEPVQTIPELSKGVITSVENTAFGEMTITFKPVENATAYKVVRDIEKDGEFEDVVALTDANTYVVVDKGAASVKETYYYKVIPMADGSIKGETYHVEGEASKIVSGVSLIPQKTTGVSMQKYLLGIYSISWKKVDKADGYEIYRAKDDGEFTLHKTTGKILSLKLESLGLKKNQKYSYKIRAFVKNGNKKIYGKFSKVVTVTTKGIF